MSDNLNENFNDNIDKDDEIIENKEEVQEVQENVQINEEDEEYIIQQKSENVFDKFIEFITGFSSEERVKIRKLKDINKKLKHLKFKFYNNKKDLISDTFLYYIYDLYRLSQNFTKYINIKTHSKSIKLILFEIFSTDKQKKFLEKFEKGLINEKIKKGDDKKAVISQIQNDLNEYISSFSKEISNKINVSYNQIEDLSNIITYDWFFLLHKFDSEITESNFNYKPNFEDIEGKYIIDELVVINDYIESIDFDREWKYVYEYIKYITQDDGLIKILNKIIQKCKVLKRDHYLLLIIKLINKDPFFKPKLFTSKTFIVEDYLTNFKIEVRKSIDFVIKDIKRDRIVKLLLNIFHKTSIMRLKFYNEKLNDFLNKKGFYGFKYIEPLNYLKAFLLDYCKGIIKSRIDFLLIKGTWSTKNISLEYSTLLIEFNRLSDKLLEFDNSLAEDEYYGKSIRQLAFVVTRDPGAKNMMRKTIINVDSEAEKLLFESVKLFNTALNKMKFLIEDKKLKLPKMIINFHKLEWEFPEKIEEGLNDIYNKLHNFIILIKYFIKDKKM